MEIARSSDLGIATNDLCSVFEELPRLALQVNHGAMEKKHGDMMNIIWYIYGVCIYRMAAPKICIKLPYN